MDGPAVDTWTVVGEGLGTVGLGTLLKFLYSSISEVRKEVAILREEKNRESKDMWDAMRKYEEDASRQNVRNAELYVPRGEIQALRQEIREEFAELRRVVVETLRKGH